MKAEERTPASLECDHNSSLIKKQEGHVARDFISLSFKA